MVLSSCGIDLPLYINKQFLKVNDTYSIHNSTYSLKIISIDCTNYPFLVTIQILKNSSIIATDTFDMWSGTNSYHLYDTNKLCIQLGWQDCQLTPNSIDLDIWYVGLYQPTHIIKYDIGDWEYSNILEQYISDFSNILIPLVPATNPNIIYIKTEYNNAEKCIDMYIAYIGSSQTSAYATVPGELEIIDWGMFALIVLSVALSILLFTIVAPVLAAGGPITLPILAYLIVALGLFLVSIYNIYHIISASRTATQIAKNVAISQSQDNALTDTKDELLNLCTTNKIAKLDYYKSLKEANVVYTNKAKAEFPLIDIQSEFNTFKICADNLIASFNTTMDCGTLLNNMNTCAIKLISKIQSEKGTKYASGTYIPPKCSDHLVKEVCDANSTCIWSYEECISKKSCIIKNPLDNTCMLSTDNLWKGMPYVIGASLIGIATFVYVPGVVGFVGNGINDWNKTLGSRPTETSVDGLNSNKPTYKKSKSKKK